MQDPDGTLMALITLGKRTEATHVLFAPAGVNLPPLMANSLSEAEELRNCFPDLIAMDGGVTIREIDDVHAALVANN